MSAFFASSFFIQGKELERKCQECETLSEELKKSKTLLEMAKKSASNELWTEKEQVLRKQYQIQVTEGQSRIAALNAKIRCVSFSSLILYA